MMLMVIIHTPPPVVLLNHSNAYSFDPSHFLYHYGYKLQDHIVMHAQRGRLIRLSGCLPVTGIQSILSGPRLYKLQVSYTWFSMKGLY